MIVLVTLALIAGFYFYNKQNKQQNPNITPPPTSTSTSLQVVNYYCNEGTIKASYGEKNVQLLLKDGRDILLPQTVSGSGIRYELGPIVFVSKGDNAFLTEDNIDTYTNCISGIVVTNEDTNNFTDTSKTFSFSYPTEFLLSGGELGYTVNWAQQSTSTGLMLAEVIIPRTFMPSTNFSEAKFTIGTSVDADAIENCLQYNLGNQVTTTPVMINGREFTKINFSDAGAGNFYETTTYRTIYNNQCYAIEYIIHSTNIGNYSPDQGMVEFDKAKITSIIEGIVNSFKFL